MRKKYVSSLLKRMFRSAMITAAFTEFTQIIALTVDAIVVCRFLGAPEIAAVGLAGPFLFLVGIPACCLSSGLQTVCAQEMGRGNTDQVSRRFSEIALFTLLSLSVVTAAVMLTVPQIAGLLGAGDRESGLQGPTAQYLYGIGPEIVPFVLMSVLIPVVILDNGSRTAMAASIVGCVSDIALDIVAALRGWGLFGIGMASTVSVALSVLVLLSHFLRKDSMIRLRLSRPRGRSVLEVIRLGLPKAVHSGANMLRCWLLNNLVLFIGGSAAMSVLSVHGTLLDFVDIIPVGIAGAVSVLAGITCGEKNGEELEGTGILAHRYVLVTSLVIMGALIALQQPLCRLMLAKEPDAWPLMRFALYCIAACIAPGALIYARVSYLQAIGRIKEAQLLEIAANMISLTVFALLLSLVLWPGNVRGVFLAFPVSKVAVLVLVYLIQAKRSGRLRPAPRDYMALEEDFFPQVWDTIAYPIDSVEESVLTSKQVWLFCRGHKFDPRMTYYASVAIEEVATNILEHGRPRRGGAPRTDLRVTIADSDLILRFRDNGRSFHMNALARVIQAGTDPFSCLGLRIICAAADDISYYRVFGMNTTIIRVKAAAAQ